MFMAYEEVYTDAIFMTAVTNVSLMFKLNLNLINHIFTLLLLMLLKFVEDIAGEFMYQN